MVSLCIWIAVLLGALVVPAWAMAFAARKAGSRHGRIRVGLFVNLLIGVVQAILIAVAALVPQDNEVTSLVVSLGIVLINLLASFELMRWGFGLTVGRTFLPFGASMVVNVIAAVLVFGVIRPLVCQTFRTPSKGMAPTLEPGDRISVNRLLAPRRWDLVVYRHEHSGVLYCKRVAGLPGERLRFEGGSLFVNDQPAVAPPVLAGRLRATPFAARGRYREGETITLGEQEYFYIGDNVDNSADSRLEGPSDAGSLGGVVDLIYWPPRKAAILR